MALHNPPKQAPLLALLGQLAESGFLSANQITKVKILYFDVCSGISKVGFGLVILEVGKVVVSQRLVLNPVEAMRVVVYSTPAPLS